jgi:hypothetical protein
VCPAMRFTSFGRHSSPRLETRGGRLPRERSGQSLAPAIKPRFTDRAVTLATARSVWLLPRSRLWTETCPREAGATGAVFGGNGEPLEESESGPAGPSRA